MSLMLCRRSIIAALFAALALSTEADEPKLPPGFSEIDKIDCHLHLRYTGPEIASMAKDLRFRLIDISTNNFDIAWQAGLARRQMSHFPGTVSHVTAFSMKGFAEGWWMSATLDQLEHSFQDDHAIGVKIWKDVGMRFRNAKNQFVLIDDRRFDPLYEYLVKVDKTLVLHIADPIEFWQAPETITYPKRRRIVEKNGAVVMYGKEGVPSHAELIAARDRVLARHPKLRVLGVHLASLEHSLLEIGKRLDTYPNLAIDTSARIPDLIRFNRDELRAFLIKYQDRILYGSDMGIKPNHNGENKAKALRARWIRDWKLFAGTERVEISPNPKGDSNSVLYLGLGLPNEVLKKIFHDNAIAWFPDLEPKAPSDGKQ